MSLYVNSLRRINRNIDQQEDMKKLTQANIFSRYRDILMLSAIIGYRNNKSTPIPKGHTDDVLMQFFSEIDHDFMDLLAYASSQKTQTIMSDDKYDIFESYANAGFPILLKLLDIDLDNITEEDKHTALDTLLSLLLTDDIIIE